MSRDYRMTVHLFGAVSLPSCASYGLRRTAIKMVDPILEDGLLRVGGG